MLRHDLEGAEDPTQLKFATLALLVVVSVVLAQENRVEYDEKWPKEEAKTCAEQSIRGYDSLSSNAWMLLEFELPRM